MRILWDEPKRQATRATRGLDFAVIGPDFFEAATIVPARDGRWRATGSVGDILVTVIFSRLGAEAVSVISMRRASRRERLTHEARETAADR